MTPTFARSKALGAATFAVCMLAGAIPGARASDGPVAGLAVQARDEQVLVVLQGLLDEPLERYPAPAALDLEVMLARARATGLRGVVIVDTAARRVELLRASDGTVVTRLLPPDVASSAYASAFVAAELLGLSDDLDLVIETRERTSTGAPAKGPRLLAGAALDVRADSAASMVRPAALLVLRLGEGGGPLVFEAGARAGLFGIFEVATPAGQVRVSQNDLGLQAAAGLEHRGTLALLSLRGGVSLERARLLRDGASPQRSARAWLGAGLDARAKLTESLEILVDAGAVFTPRRARYDSQGSPLFARSHLGFSALVGVGFGSSW